MRRRHVPARLAAVALAAAVGACGLGDKEALTSDVLDSVELLDAAGPMRGTLRVEVALVALPAGLEAPGLSPQPETQPAAPLPEAPSATLWVDLGAQRAAIGWSDRPAGIFDGLTAYGRRIGAAETDARPWMKVDLGALADGEGEVDFLSLSPAGVANALSPSMLLDLIAGALTGSVEQAATADVAGVATRAYEANFDLEKAIERSRRDRYPEDERTAIYETFDRLGVTRRVHPGTVWIDDAGLPRRFRIDLRISPRKDFLFDVGLVLELTDTDADMPVPPGELELLETSSLAGFLQAVTPRAERP